MFVSNLVHRLPAESEKPEAMEKAAGYIPWAASLKNVSQCL
jgi:hypothetical protein